MGGSTTKKVVHPYGKYIIDNKDSIIMIGQY